MRGDLRLFFRQLSTLLDAGLPADRAFRVLAGDRAMAGLAGVAGKIAARLEAGESLSSAIGEAGEPFDGFDRAVIAASEKTGELGPGIAALARHHETRHADREKLRTALTYPAVLTVAAIGAITALMVFVIPRFEPIFRQGGTDMPALTQGLLTLSEAVRDYGWIALVLAGTLLAGLFTPAGRRQADEALLRMPVFGRLLESIEIERWTRGLSLLAGRGVPLPDALVVASALFSNGVMREAAEQLAARVREGRTLSAAAAESGRFPDAALQLIRIGEESGSLDLMLARTADYHGEEARGRLTRLTALIEPFIIIVLGGVVATVVIALMLTVTSLNDAML
ncbi:type II secretion system F family protein [Nisaea acidiphila]|uniref:General secretion pathway protein F n=1 Tax=Nisaea acidiphila TaxID=1862145 RepID=A0A9J7AQI5_9PROT|nr:type II secretion system F family protein [Nisaea acidiphila]UUX48620.1 type II secretion system F family protein [Nisaea acidiphila]